MPHYRIGCGACGWEFDVELDTDSKRCPSCGVEHSGPWHDPEVVGIELADALGYEIKKPRVLMQPADPRGGRA